MKSKITLKYTTKPVFLEVESGYSTLGAFIILAYKKGEEPIELFPERVKKVHDNIPDIFLLPYDAKDIKNIKLLIYGKYSPAPSHKQIRILYNFVQEAVSLKVDQPKSNIIEEEIEDFSKTYFNYFEFE